MITALLVALSAPAPRSLPQIAADLGTTPDRLRIALEQCERMGYLDRDDDACSTGACGTCPVPCGVTLRPGTRGSLPVAPSWWRLTDRGQRAASMARTGA